MRAWPLLFLAAATVVGGSAASADVWSEARRIDRATLPDLFWSATASCETRADDLLRRQCRALADARGRAWNGGTYVVRAGAGAISSEGGATIVRGCLVCAEPLPGIGYLVTRGSVGEGPAGVIGPELGRPASAPSAGAELEIAFRLPTTPEAWSQGTRRGFYVEPVAWRLAGDKPAPAAGPAAEVVPDTLNAQQIKAAMAPVSDQVQVCFDSYGIPGKADLGFEVTGDGRIIQIEVRGELNGTPTATCVVEAVKKAKFPKFKRPSMYIQYPFILR